MDMGFIQIRFTCDFSDINLTFSLFGSPLRLNDCFCLLIHIDAIKGEDYDNFGFILNGIFVIGNAERTKPFKPIYKSKFPKVTFQIFGVLAILTNEKYFGCIILR